MEQFISEHGGVIVSGIVTIALLGTIMTVILAVGNMDAYEISKIIGGCGKSSIFRTGLSGLGFCKSTKDLESVN